MKLLLPALVFTGLLGCSAIYGQTEGATTSVSAAGFVGFAASHNFGLNPGPVVGSSTNIRHKWFQAYALNWWSPANKTMVGNGSTMFASQGFRVNTGSRVAVGAGMVLRYTANSLWTKLSPYPSVGASFRLTPRMEASCDVLIRDWNTQNNGRGGICSLETMADARHRILVGMDVMVLKFHDQAAQIVPYGTQVTFRVSKLWSLP